jgi:hypothetical protein
LFCFGYFNNPHKIICFFHALILCFRKMTVVLVIKVTDRAAGFNARNDRTPKTRTLSALGLCSRKLQVSCLCPLQIFIQLAANEFKEEQTPLDGSDDPFQSRRETMADPDVDRQEGAMGHMPDEKQTYNALDMLGGRGGDW